MKLDLTKLPVLEGIVGFLALAIVLTFVGAFAATESSDGEEVLPTTAATATPDDGGTPTVGDEFDVALVDSKFNPAAYTVATGATVTFNITNNGKALHNMHISPTGDDFPEDLCEGGADPCSDPSTIRGGATATLEWGVPASPGTYAFRCDFHPVEMKGEITVR